MTKMMIPMTAVIDSNHMYNILGIDRNTVVSHKFYYFFYVIKIQQIRRLLSILFLKKCVISASYRSGFMFDFIPLQSSIVVSS